MRLGTGELILILIIALVVFGPSRLPELAKTLGQALNAFKSEASKVTEGIKDDLDEKKES